MFVFLPSTGISFMDERLMVTGPTWRNSRLRAYNVRSNLKCAPHQRLQSAIASGIIPPIPHQIQRTRWQNSPYKSSC